MSFLMDEASVKKNEEHVEELFRELENAYERYFEVANRIDRGSINSRSRLPYESRINSSILTYPNSERRITVQYAV